MNTISSNTFGQGQYVGYYWYSDQKKPEILIEPQTIDPNLFQQELPFIIEAAFFDPQHNISIQIRNIDGNNSVQKVDLSIYLQSADLAYIHYYKSHDLIGVEQYRVIEVWKEVAKETLAGMKTLEPAFTAFAGFGN